MSARVFSAVCRRVPTHNLSCLFPPMIKQPLTPTLAPCNLKQKGLINDSSMSCRFLCVKMRKYGVPYKGSKSKLAEWIVNILPPENTLVDLFAGGCAVTHAAIVSGKWKNVVCNDKDPRGIRLFIDSIHGKYTVKNCPEWVSREEFEEKKDEDPYIAICWSFGNNMQGYLYGRNVEDYKHSLWDLCHAQTERERHLTYKRCIRELQAIVRNRYLNDKHYGDCQSFESLQRLEALERLQSFEALERLQSFEADYKDVDIPKHSVIYCDVPYANTSGYKYGIDQTEFINWCNRQRVPVYVSSYIMDGLHLIAEHEHRSIYSQKANNKVTERIYGNDLAFDISGNMLKKNGGGN